MSWRSFLLETASVLFRFVRALPVATVQSVCVERRKLESVLHPSDPTHGVLRRLRQASRLGCGIITMLWHPGPFKLLRDADASGARHSLRLAARGSASGWHNLK